MILTLNQLCVGACNLQSVNTIVSKIQKATKFQRPSFSSSRLLLWIAFGAILSAALIVRIIPAKYGFYLNEFASQIRLYVWIVKPKQTA